MGDDLHDAGPMRDWPAKAERGEVTVDFRRTLERLFAHLTGLT